MANEEHLQTLLDRRESILKGDAERIASQHAAGKCTARERVAKIFDAGSFIELDMLNLSSGVVTGWGTVHSRPAYCFAQDYTSSGGAMSKAQSAKIVKLLEMARMTGAPVLALCDTAGAKIAEGAQVLAAYSEVYAKMVRLSGVCPMICAVMGPCQGIAVLAAQLADISIQVKKTGELLLSSPLVLDAGAQAAGGADAMSVQGGIALTTDNEDAACALIASLLDLLPSCNAEDAPAVVCDDLNRVLEACDPSDGLALAADMTDDGQYIRLFPAYGTRCHTLLARVGGRSAGIVATDHTNDEGRLDAAACAKIARFVRFCDCWHLPVVSLLHTDGLAAAGRDGQAALMRASAQMMYAYAEATTPKIAVVTGHAIGAVYAAMAGRPVSDMTYAWPGTVIAPLTAETAVRTLYGERVKAGDAPVESQRAELEAEYRAASDGLSAAAAGLADDVIVPGETRKYVICAMEMLDSKRDSNPPKKHGNMPL